MTRLLSRNLYHLMRGASRRTSLAKLKKRGHKNVSVLSYSAVNGLIDMAVENTLKRRGIDMSKGDVQEDVRHEFLSLMRERDSLQNTVDALLREKNELKENQQHLKDEINRTTAEYEQVQVGPDLEADDELKALMEKLQGALMSVLGEAGVSQQLSDKTLAIVTQAIQEHRDLTSKKSRVDQEVQLGQLERRISKLKRKLQETEDMLAKAQTDGVTVEGIAGEPVTAGVSGSDPKAHMKKELLGEIFRLNVELREMLNAN